jgi:pilus assembly protein CpaC
MSSRRATVTSGVTAGLLGFALAVAVPVAQDRPGAGQQPFVQAPADGTRLSLLASTSIVLITDFDIERISITNDQVADALAVTAREILINGKAPGTISLIVWGRGGQRMHYPLVVDPPVSTLEQQLQLLFPGEDIRVNATENATILSGRVSNNNVMLRAGEIAAASLKDRRVINLLQLPGGAGSQQVMLQVRFGEVNRRAVSEAGLTLFTTRTDFTSRSTTGQFPAPTFDDVDGKTGGLVFSDFLNLFFFQREEGIGGVLKALEQKGWFTSLAEPNLIAYNGAQATFLAGGEIPVPVVSGTTGNVSVEYKEFGVRLTFTPTIAGDVIRLKVRPEVSVLDFANGVTLNGFRIPALQTRYAETEVELRDGQSFAIAGLMNTTGQEDKSYIPILSRIPIIGNLFKSKATRDDQTELLVLITPRLSRPLNPDEVPPLPQIIRDPATGRGRGGGGGGGIADHLRGPAGVLDRSPLSAAPRPGGGERR